MNDLIHLLAQQLKAASDGFVPRNFEELLSSKSAEIISFHLDISREAPVVPRQSWRALLSRNAKSFQQEAHQILNAYSGYLSNEVVDLLASLEHSFFLTLYASLEVIQAVNHQEGFQRHRFLLWRRLPFRKTFSKFSNWSNF